jgi:hypothetical protein
MKISIATVLLGLALASCAPSTPQARIEQNPEKFAALSQSHQNLVQQGQIARGMPPEAVELAWGNPHSRFEGVRGGKNTARWDYEGSRPVYTTSRFGGYGFGHGGSFGRGRYSAIGFGMGPDVTFIPQRIASVWFISNRVDSWERAR